MTEDVGRKIKELRISKNLTLKDLSAETNLSIGFLSQLERGLTTIAIDSLDKVAKALEVNLSYFLDDFKSNKKVILRSYEKEVFQVYSNQFIHYHLTNDVGEKSFLPRLIEILPTNSKEEVAPYPHEGEEFIYVLEGILTLFINNEQHELYPGDSAHYNSSIVHNWANYTSKTVKILTVNGPSVLR
ncbi:XRE family transcriptional regulator [Clostridium sp. CX1]|uniref:XRE family transcriptional regulator n=1 Tax=Clostridium tanneri TaxID=3037988 RepID=A0ABU4JQN0_9CLOT|nr:MULTISPECIES: XRE family transcriptional regulator [unclassified Clostridium]MCT8978427.1 XRE family transcriptional regulator [Clostridium sp. CX1]MDW8800458.1 XRE family transcriptional regulator [Clostridium sp. A1-XYC3]